MSAIVASFIPLREMTRMAASWMEWTRYSWTTSSFDLTMTIQNDPFRSLNGWSAYQNFRSVRCGAASLLDGGVHLERSRDRRVLLRGERDRLRQRPGFRLRSVDGHRKRLLLLRRERSAVLVVEAAALRPRDAVDNHVVGRVRDFDLADGARALADRAVVGDGGGHRQRAYRRRDRLRGGRHRRPGVVHNRSRFRRDRLHLAAVAARVPDQRTDEAEDDDPRDDDHGDARVRRRAAGGRVVHPHWRWLVERLRHRIRSGIRRRVLDHRLCVIRYRPDTALELIQLHERRLDAPSQPLILRRELLARRFPRHLHERIPVRPVVLPQNLDLARSIAAFDVYSAKVVGRHRP